MLKRMQDGDHLSFFEQLSLTFRLSLPAMLAQISTIVMEYIDAAMVGHLGAEATASIGIISTSTWLFGGLVMAGSIGFTVQVAQKIGAKQDAEARNIMKEGLFSTFIYSTILAFIACLLSYSLPEWLTNDTSLHNNARIYFIIFMLALPIHQMNSLGGGMLQASGNMKTPGILHVIACFLDVVFNALLIFPSGTLSLGPISLPGADLGVPGAALGTVLSEIVIAIFMLTILLKRSEKLRLRPDEKIKVNKEDIKTAIKIACPVAIEQFLMCGAYVAETFIVSPLGKIPIAAHSLAITAESLCYMPGFGIASAATTLIGQSIGAKRRYLARQFAWISVGLGIALMTCTGVLLFIFAPEMMAMLTPVPEVRELGVIILRIEAFAEPLYAAAIVCNGSFRGAGDTLIPSCMNFLSMWVVRLPLSWALAYPMGLGIKGVWIAMAAELCVRGLIFLTRMKGKGWMKKVET